MDARELLICTQRLHGQIANSLLTERQSVDQLLSLVAETRITFEVSDHLQHDLIIVQSLVALKRLQPASARLANAVLHTIEPGFSGWDPAFD